MIVPMPKELSPAGSMGKSSSIATLCEDGELEERTPTHVQQEGEGENTEYHGPYIQPSP